MLTYEHEAPLRLLQDNPKLGTEGARIVAAFYAVLPNLPSGLQVKYPRIATKTFPAKALERLEALFMADTTYWGGKLFAQAELRGKAEGKAEGKAQGTAEMLLLILNSRNIALDNTELERITTCTDLEQLHYWATRAFQVDSAERLFSS